jgi:hypothetical protein
LGAGKSAAGDVEGGSSTGDGSAAPSSSTPEPAGAPVSVAGGTDLHEDDDDAGDFTEAEVEEAFDFLDLDHNRMVGFMEIKHLLACMVGVLRSSERAVPSAAPASAPAAAREGAQCRRRVVVGAALWAAPQ